MTEDEDGVSTGEREPQSAETTRLALLLCPSASRGFALVISYYTIAACLAAAHAGVHLHARALTHVYLSPIGPDRIFFPGKFAPIAGRPEKIRGTRLFQEPRVIVARRNGGSPEPAAGGIASRLGRHLSGKMRRDTD